MKVLRQALSVLMMTAAWVASAPAAAVLVTYLEPRIVDEMETVRFTIRAEGTAQAEAPDFSPLAQDFDVLGNQTSSRISSINGRTVASVEYQLSLRPKRTGEIVVPSLVIGNERTEPIRIVVRPMDPAMKESIASMVFFETELSANPVYVQAETVLTRRLFYSQGVQIYSDLPGVPEVANAVVIPLGETQSRSVLRGGQRYGVIEQQFALFPEQSGVLTIPSISVTSSVRVQSGGRTRRSGIRVSTDAIDLSVMPIPESYPADASWLPATDVSLTYRWLPAEARIEVGAPLTFELEVDASGNRGSAIPPIPLPLPPERFKIYPEAPVMEESARSGSVAGHRRARYALIPTTPGPVSMAPLSVTWWDTAADALRTTRVEVADLTVTGTPADTPRPAAPETPETEAAAPPAREPAPGRPWLLVATAGALGVLVVAVLFRLFERFDGLPRPGWLGSAVAPNRRRRLRALKAATGGKDLPAYRRALTDYLACVYGLPAAAALSTFRRDPDAAAMLDALDQAIYAQSTGTPPDTRALTLRARRAGRRHGVRHQGDALPALYG